ncbi:hypothetical protein J1605_008444 [Eschrichtius robustus]|uniref:Uncharacterized protein n=1 Tax=Eschrichtius robustus TaxID=9764 RepID=A0AB34GW11_ESCRO|nr:hypothetical protein J1605_008444 [Eschrichtius robustus]
MRAFSSRGKRGLLFVSVRRLLIVVSSLVAERGILIAVASLVAECGILIAGESNLLQFLSSNLSTLDVELPPVCSDLDI